MLVDYASGTINAGSTRCLDNMIFILMHIHYVIENFVKFSHQENCISTYINLSILITLKKGVTHPPTQGLLETRSLYFMYSSYVKKLL